MEHTLWADRGHLLEPDSTDSDLSALCVGVSRLGSAQLSGAHFSMWIQVRGTSWIDSKEGRFKLRRGDWIALERDSRPVVQSERHGLCIGITLAPGAHRVLGRLLEGGLYTGRGSATAADLSMALHLWRQAGLRLAAGPQAGHPLALRALAMHLGGMQAPLVAGIERCPGRSRSRKRQVFSRMQRAHLYLEGNRDRVVRITELADLTSFSSWYFSKTFHALYQESPQAAAARMRLERAAELLVDSSMMIGEVAAASGFDNCCSFARAFRGRYGMSASGFRSAAGSVAGARTHSAKSRDAARKVA